MHSAPANWIRSYQGQTIYLALALIGGFIAFFPILSPLTVMYPSEGSDQSWSTVLGEAQKLGLRFGQDIIFTGGPLSSAFTKYFEASTFPYVAAVLLTACIAYSLATTLLAQRAGTGLAAVPVLAVPLLTNVTWITDAFLIGLPAVSALAMIATQASMVRSILAAAAILAAAGLTLAKFSVFFVAVASFIVLDVLVVRKRHMPLHTIGYFGSLGGFFWLADSAADFRGYLVGSLQTSAAYTGAMSLPGGKWGLHELGAFLVSLLIVLACALRIEVSAVRRGGVSRTEAGGRLLVLAAYLFVCFKAGFVRQDLHTIIAWSGLALGASAYAPLGWRQLGRRVAVGVLLCVTLMVSAVAVPVISVAGLQTPSAYFKNTLSEARRELLAIPEFVASPNRWIQDRKTEKERAWQSLRDAAPLPRLDGSVDMVPSRQSEVIAHAMQYRPRLTIQEYTSYSRPLIEANRRHFYAEDAPRYLIFEPGSIDERHPALAEGPLWPDFLRLYEPHQDLGITLIMKRRPSMLPELLGARTNRSARFGEPILIGDGAIFMYFQIEPTLLGRIADFVFKTPPIYIRLHLANGEERSFRVIPGIAREGFLVSPLIEVSSQFAMLAGGLVQDPTRIGSPQRVVTASVYTTRLGSLLYRKDIGIGIRHLDLTALHEANLGNAVLTGLSRRYSAIEVVSNQLKPPLVTLVPEGLLAHAPRRLNFPVKPGVRIRVGFGIMNAAWRGERETDGVCFRVLARSGQLLWERCLDPKHVPTDRGEQSATLRVPDGEEELVLETTCREKCSWDWSYWSAADLTTE